MTTAGFAPAGIALILAGALLRAFYVVNSKRVLRELPARFVTTVNMLMGSVLLAVLTAVWSRPPPDIDWYSPTGAFWPLAATAVLNIAIIGGELFALARTDASLVAPISATAPLFALFTGILILGEIPGPAGWAGVPLLSLGLYVLSRGNPGAADGGPPGWRRHLHTARDFLLPWRLLRSDAGVRIAFLGALAASISINFDKLAVARTSATFAPMAVLGFVGLIVATTLRREHLPRRLTPRQLGMLLLSPVIYTGVIVLFNMALTLGPASYSSALRRTSILFVILLSGPMLKERGHPERVAAGALMVLGAALLAL